MANANTGVLLDMESAPITLQGMNLAVCNALTHLVDSNLIVVNQLIRDKLNTPVVDLQFLSDVFDDKIVVDMSCSEFEALFTWVSQVVQSRDGIEFASGYLHVPKLGTQEDYSSKEAYMESYFGIVKGSLQTYTMAIKECSSKVFDLTGFLSIGTSMLDHHKLLSRLGIGVDILQNNNNNNNPFTDAHRSTYLYVPGNGGGSSNNDAQQQQQQQQQQQRGPVGRCWVHMIQHLLVTSIIGRDELHADNMFTMGARLTEYIFSRSAPMQASPARAILCESFQHVDDDVLPLVAHSMRRPEYFVRSINDHGAHNDGVSMELPAVLGSHPPEDVMHLGAWIRLYTILHSGAKPQRFEYLPTYNGRIPELVVGRNYPLQGADPTQVGTVCLLPEGRHDLYRITFMQRDPDDPDSRRRNEDAVVHMHRGVENWHAKVCGYSMTVAPLVFRRHAVFRNVDRADAAPFVAINFVGSGSGEYRQFVSITGDYTLSQGENRHKKCCFIDAHEILVPIGAFIMVNRSALAQFGLACDKPWVRGSLRYPEDDVEPVASNDKCQYNVYVMLKLKGRSEGNVRVIDVPVSTCRIADTSNIRQGDFCVSAYVQLLNPGAAAQPEGDADAE